MTDLHIFEDANPPSSSLADDRQLVRKTRASELQHKKRRAFTLADKHALLLGGTRRGKSVIMELVARSLIRQGAEGISILDPHGTVARPVIEWLAHPSSGQHARIVHIIDPSSDYAIGLNPLRPYDETWEARHDAAMALAAVTESRFEASAEETPRLARIVYVAGMLCAAHGLTLLELIEVLSLGGEELRRSLLEDFDNRVVRRELEDLCLLATKNPREFLNLVESTKNRFVRWLGDRRLVRILGQRAGLNIRTVMDNREDVIADLSSLNYPDAALVGCVYTSMVFAAARRRPAMQSARHRLIMDEAESLITPDVARMCDQSAKWGVNIFAAIQRLGQLRARGDFLADALLTNCAVWIVLGGLEAESARYVAENLFAGHVDLAEWKRGSERPTAVGQTKVILKNRTRSHQHSESHAVSETDMRSTARATAAVRAAMFSSGATFGSGDNTSFVAMPPDQILASAPIISRTTGRSNSSAGSTARGTSSAESTAIQSARAHARSEARATADGISVGEGESEALATIYEDLPTQQYSLEDQLHRLTAELITLPRREAFVRVESDAPFRARSVERVPAFRSAEFKAQILPRYLRNVARRSRYSVPVSDVDREIVGRFQNRSQQKTPTDPQSWLEEAPTTVPALLAELKAHKDAQPHPPKPRDPPQLRPEITR